MTENDTLCQQVTEDRHVVRQRQLYALRTQLTTALKIGPLTHFFYARRVAL